ncbi:ABC transporter substrate-binding protein [Actinomyces sp. 2119]|uniref:ABC transporter substrate-binding protein n=1 Tax=Actinomyces lilanjuaniae TaxID=2321394 RepID=A0ABN5PMY6_9ACTO|nr:MULTISPECIES: ABC transporter substrate-binding protein [Actinomyces]AYD89783.1 ABC transporter substrate-binding protein [Actinomyces lilanjuaniae]RJF44758.1 ABC transporter substrate-binding protein [Actinomyces sp. 2119]
MTPDTTLDIIGHPTTRRRLVGTAGLLPAAVALAACADGTTSRSGTGATASAGEGGLVIGLTYTPSIQFAPFYMALAEGHYDPGVSLRHHGASEGLFDALAAGSEQVVVAGADEAVVAASNGSDLVVVGGFYQVHPACIIVAQDSPVSTPADLEGRSIGIPGRFGESWYALQVALDAAGLSEDDLTITEIGYTQQAALVGGRVDAIIGFSNNDAVQIPQAGTPVRTVAVAEEVPLVGASVVTTGAVLDERRDELARLVSASVAGMEAFVDDPDGAVSAARDYVPDLADPSRAAEAREVAVATAELIRPGTDTPVGALSSQSVAQMLGFLETHSLLGSTATEVASVCDPLVQG